MNEKKEQKKKQRKNFWKALNMEIQEHKSSFFVYVVLRALVTLCMVLQIFNQNYENVFLCALVLVLCMVPSILQMELKIELPTTLEIIILLFIFAANYARAARRDSNNPRPALCVPPGCNSPADCCKGAGESHRLRQVSLLNSTLGSDFLLPFCKIPSLFL